MKRIVILSALISTSCFANFGGYTQKSYSNKSYLKTQFTTNEIAQFHIGCGIGTDGKPFTIIALKHPYLYPYYERSNIKISVDGMKDIILDGASKQYDDMYYSRNPSEEAFTKIRNGNFIQVSFFNDKKSTIFSLKGSNKTYNELWKECGLL